MRAADGCSLEKLAGKTFGAQEAAYSTSFPLPYKGSFFSKHFRQQVTFAYISMMHAAMTIIIQTQNRLSAPSDGLKGGSADGANRIRDGANRFVQGEFLLAVHDDGSH